MKRGHDLSGLIKFATSPAWADHLRDALWDHIGPAADEFDFELDELAEIVGKHWAGVLWGCAFEDLITRAVDPDGRNLTEDYLKRRGWNEVGPNKLYMRAIRSSVMSLYEISAIEPGTGFLARDLILGGEPIRIAERTASQTLRQWDRIGARVVQVRDKHVLSGGVLSFSLDASEILLGSLRKTIGKRGSHARFSVDRDELRELAPLVSNAWLFDVVPKAMGLVAPILHNSDGEEVVFHRVRFPFASSITQALVAERLAALPELRRENAQFWNWLGPAKRISPSETKGKATYGVTMEDGTPVLGNVELKGRALVLSVTSAERAERGTALLADKLGNLVRPPLTEIQTVQQAMAARGDNPPEPGSTIEPAIATPLVHAMLDRQYRATLDEPVGILGNITPRAAARTKVGRAKLAEWLKHLENLSGWKDDPDDPMATYDFTWLWRELGVEDLRR